MSLARRSVLAAGLGLGAAVGLAGCRDDNKRPATSSPKVGGKHPWRALEESLDGRVLRRGEAGYPTAHRLFNPRFDPIQPLAVVQAASAHDVVETIDFARRHHLALVPRAGGHSYVGASTVSGGIQLDLRGLRRVSRHGERAVVGPGARLLDVHLALEPDNLTVPSGTCPTVGAAGLTLGGGVGVESRAYGLTCDALVEAEVVTADGRTLTASESEEPELFWALRGGGGGNVGVVTRLTYATSPAYAMGMFFLHFASRDAVAVVTGWLARQRVAPRSSWSNVHLDAVAGAGPGVRVVGVSLTGDGHAEASALEAAIGRPTTQATLFARSHHDAVKLLAGCSTLSDESCHLAPAGSLQREAFAAGSDVVSRALTRTHAAAAVDHVLARGRAGRAGTLILDPLGGAVSTGDGAFPWRSAAAIAQWYVGLSSGSASEVASAYAWISTGHRALGSASLGGYVNYLEPNRPLGAYYGSSLSRLRTVKQHYDPDDFFHTSWTVSPR